MYISILLHLLWTYHHNSPKSNMTLWRSCNSAFISMLIPTRGCRGQMHNIVFSKKYQLDASGQCFEKGHLPCKLLWAWFEHNRQRFCSSWIFFLVWVESTMLWTHICQSLSGTIENTLFITPQIFSYEIFSWYKCKTFTLKYFLIGTVQISDFQYGWSQRCVEHICISHCLELLIKYFL